MAIAPGMSQWVPLPYGPFGLFLRNPIGFQLDARERLGDVVRLRAGPMLLHFLYHPRHVQRVLVDHQRNYIRGWQYGLLRRVTGDNLVVSDGDGWRWQRRMAQPAFNRPRHAAYADVMVDATAALVRQWQEQAANGPVTIDVGPAMSRLALAIASRTLFDRDVSHEADVVGSSFAVVGQYLERRLNRPFTSPPLWAPTPRTLRFRRARGALNDIVLGIIRERRREGGRDHGDLLSMLMQARDEETGAAMSDEQLRGQVLAFMMAGHETTATALTWTFHLLARHPQVRQRLRDEAALVLGDRMPTVADVAQLSATRMAIEESMRLYPPVWVLPRHVVSDDEIDGCRIPAGSTAVICPYVTHRHPATWRDPETFDPDRFTPERAAERPKGAYFPFLGGAHACIGSEFAMIEMRLIVAMLLRAFDIEPVDGAEVRPVPSLALKPGAPVRVSLRSTGFQPVTGHRLEACATSGVVPPNVAP